MEGGSMKINLKEKLSLFSEHWSPKVIAEMNDYSSNWSSCRETSSGTATRIPMRCSSSSRAR